MHFFIPVVIRCIITPPKQTRSFINSISIPSGAKIAYMNCALQYRLNAVSSYYVRLLSLAFPVLFTGVARRGSSSSGSSSSSSSGAEGGNSNNTEESSQQLLLQQSHESSSFMPRFEFQPARCCRRYHVLSEIVEQLYEERKSPKRLLGAEIGVNNGITSKYAG